MSIGTTMIGKIDIPLYFSILSEFSRLIVFTISTLTAA